MPQIWMTYDELAALLGCETNDVRIQALQRALDRKRSRDGHTRAKLDVLWMARFYAAIRDAHPVLDQAIRDLQKTHREMNREAGGMMRTNRMTGYSPIADETNDVPTKNSPGRPSSTYRLNDAKRPRSSITWPTNGCEQANAHVAAVPNASAPSGGFAFKYPVRLRLAFFGTLYFARTKSGQTGIEVFH